MKWQYFVAGLAALIILPATAGMRDEDRKAPPPLPFDGQRTPSGYIFVEGVPDLRLYVEGWILQLFGAHPGDTVSKQTFRKIYEIKRRQRR